MVGIEPTSAIYLASRVSGSAAFFFLGAIGRETTGAAAPASAPDGAPGLAVAATIQKQL